MGQVLSYIFKRINIFKRTSTSRETYDEENPIQTPLQYPASASTTSYLPTFFTLPEPPAVGDSPEQLPILSPNPMPLSADSTTNGSSHRIDLIGDTTPIYPYPTRTPIYPLSPFPVTCTVKYRREPASPDPLSGDSKASIDSIGDATPRKGTRHRDSWVECGSNLGQNRPVYMRSLIIPPIRPPSPDSLSGHSPTVGPSESDPVNSVGDTLRQDYWVGSKSDLDETRLIDRCSLVLSPPCTAKELQEEVLIFSTRSHPSSEEMDFATVVDLGLEYDDEEEVEIVPTVCAGGSVGEPKERDEDGEVIWLNHYNSRQRILLVGEGDFSFSASLALEFGSASNIVATSLDSNRYLRTNYRNAMNNIQSLTSRGAMVLHNVDATEMANYSSFQQLKFDRIVYNFPLNGFFPDESRESQLQ